MKRALSFILVLLLLFSSTFTTIFANETVANVTAGNDTPANGAVGNETPANETVANTASKTEVVTNSAITADETAKNDQPTIAFPVISDIHCGNPVNDRKFKNVLEDLKTINPNYNVLTIVGDMTASGSDDNYKMMKNIMNPKDSDSLIPTDKKVLYALGNHEYFNYRTDTSETDKISQQRFLDQTGMPGLYHDSWVDQYHFVFLGSEQYKTNKEGSIYPGDSGFISDEQFAWLESKLAENADPQKPIFLFLHQAVLDTVAGTNKDYNCLYKEQGEKLQSILNKYPQVILFTGHSHYDLNTPGNIWRKGYTVFNTASTAEVLKEGVGGGDESAGDDLSQGLYVEVYGDKVVVKSREFSKKTWIDSRQYTIPLPASGSPDGAPKWSDNDKIEFTGLEARNVKLNWSKPVCSSDIMMYKILRNGTKLAQVSGDINSYNDKSLNVGTEYNYEIIAVDNIGNECVSPLKGCVTTPAAEKAALPDVVNIRFDDSTIVGNVVKDFSPTENNGTIEKTAKIEYDSDFNKNVLSVDGQSGIRIKNNESVMLQSLTISTSFKVANIGNNPVIIGKAEGSGYDIEMAGGKIEFWLNIGGSYAVVRSKDTIDSTKIYYVTVTYDGKYERMYINGELQDEVEKQGTVTNRNDVDLLMGGDPWSQAETEAGEDFAASCMKGKIGHLYMYSYSLTPAEVKDLYEKTVSPEKNVPIWSEGTALTCENVQSRSLELKWQGASDDTGTVRYMIYKDGNILDLVSGNKTSYKVEGLDIANKYSFKVIAVDMYGNKSGELTLDTETSNIDENIIIKANTFKDINGKAVTKLVGGQYINTSATVTNTSATVTNTSTTVTNTHETESRIVSVVVALCDSKGNIINMSYANCQIVGGESKTVEAGFNIPKAADGYYIKIYACEDTNQMKQLTNILYFTAEQ